MYTCLRKNRLTKKTIRTALQRTLPHNPKTNQFFV